MDSLLQCRAVCKSWNSLLKSSPFILSHLKYTLLIRSNKNKNEKEKDEQFILNAGIYQEQRCELYTLDCDHVNDEYTKRRVIPTCGIKAIYDGGRDINLEDFVADGTCNGLIFLLRKNERGEPVGESIIWNPCVRRFLVLPSSSVSPNEGLRLYKLGYDSHNNDFKLVHIVKLVEGSQTPYRFQVFSLLGGSWKEVNSPVDFNPYLYDFTALEICGALHWICGDQRNCKIEHESTAIVTFNLSSELFGKMAIPEALKKRRWIEYCHIHRYRESLALLLERTRGYDLWAMTEYGVAESWTKLVTIRLTPFYPPRCFPERCLGHNRLYFRKSGDIVVGMCYGVEQIDPTVPHVKKLAVGARETGFIDPFLESLVLLDRSDAFSY